MRALTFVLGGLATGVAFYVSSFGHLIQAYTSLISLFNAPILALFLLGMLTTRARFLPWLFGALLAVCANLWIQNTTTVHWIYYFPLSLGVTLITGYVGSLLVSGPQADRELTVWRTRATSR